ncbi:hypothetical protein AM571_PC02183 (plasmid) [Rhizobium etli 8C-3]|uniref:Uncharacterized protein n=1 Tax=Rhizobium etli 8C-3 TaxID=538025 RepID=A0A1L5PI60_RHIET|nr:hypothetical protein AM571_PC02183 [Rhizobium etli 8C-3]
MSSSGISFWMHAITRTAWGAIGPWDNLRRKLPISMPGVAPVAAGPAASARDRFDGRGETAEREARKARNEYA